MPSELPRYTLRAKQEILDKMKEIAEKNERSINQEIVYVLKKHIEEYEKSKEREELKGKLSNSEKIS